MDQGHWSEMAKGFVWQQIITHKIRNQRLLPERLDNSAATELLHYELEVLSDDLTNREGTAAKVYFTALFGPGFRRGVSDETNAALNYGYKILASTINRMLCSHGYNLALGIHHRSRKNPFNLTYDLIEPWRPLIDQIVCENPGREMDWEYKKLFIEFPRTTIDVDGQEITIEQYIENTSLMYLKKLNEMDKEISIA